MGRRLRRPVGLSVYLFLLFFLAGTAISVGTGVFAYRVAREAYLERAKESLWNTSNTARDVILHVWLPLVTRKTALAASSLGSENLSLGDRASLSRALADIYRNFPEFRRLNLYNLDGVLLASSDPLFQEGGIDFSRRIQVGEVGLLPLRRAGPGGEEVISFVLPVKRDGMNAYLVADLDVKVVNQEISSKRVGISGEIYLVDERGRLVTYPRYGLEAYGVKVLGEPLETEGVRRATAGESGISVYRNYLGEEVRFLLTLAEPGWVALFVEDPDGRTYGLDRFYLARGTHVLPPGAYRYTLVPPRGLHRVWAVYTDQAPTTLRLEGVYRDFEGVLRLYLEAAQARRHDRAETFFYLR